MYINYLYKLKSLQPPFFPLLVKIASCVDADDWMEHYLCLSPIWMHLFPLLFISWCKYRMAITKKCQYLVSWSLLKADWIFPISQAGLSPFLNFHPLPNYTHLSDFCTTLNILILIVIAWMTDWTYFNRHTHKFNFWYPLSRSTGIRDSHRGFSFLLYHQNVCLIHCLPSYYDHAVTKVCPVIHFPLLPLQ